MKKLIIISLIFSACSSNKDEQFCQCMEVSEAFNVASNEVLKGEKSSMTMEERNALKKKKDKACANYKTTPGDQLLELKKGCEK